MLQTVTKSRDRTGTLRSASRLLIAFLFQNARSSSVINSRTFARWLWSHGCSASRPAAHRSYTIEAEQGVPTARQVRMAVNHWLEGQTGDRKRARRSEIASTGYTVGRTCS